jgi:hypothetical protein
MRTFYRREWDEQRGDAHDDWGTSIWYFEVEDGQPLRQVEVYENGNILKYSLDFLEDLFGGLADSRIDQKEFERFEVSQPVFDFIWALPRKTDGGPPPPNPLEFLIRRTDPEGEWFDVSATDTPTVLRPTSLVTEIVPGFGHLRLLAHGVEVSFTFEDPGIQVTFYGPIDAHSARSIVEEVAAQVCLHTGQSARIVEL